MNLTIRKFIDLGQLGEHEATIHVRYSPGRPGTWYRRNGDPGDPPEPAEVEIEGVSVLGFEFADSGLLPIGEWEESDWLMEAVSDAYEARMTPPEP